MQPDATILAEDGHKVRNVPSLPCHCIADVVLKVALLECRTRRLTSYPRWNMPSKHVSHTQHRHAFNREPIGPVGMYLGLKEAR